MVRKPRNNNASCRLPIGLALLVVIAPSCGGEDVANRSEPSAFLRSLETDYPAVADLAAHARSHPAVAVADGFVVRSESKLSVYVGTRATDPWRIRAGGQDVIVRRVGASRESARLDGGAVVFEQASPGLDVSVFALPVGVEELLLARGPDATVATEWQMPQGWRAEPVAGDDRLVQVLDGRGVARLRYRAAAAWDARGRDVDVRLAVVGNRVTVHVEGVDAWPVLIDPAWEETSRPAYPRFHHATTMLPDGTLLLSGLKSVAEVFDPKASAFTAVGEMHEARVAHQATLLRTGKVLITGGLSPEDGFESVLDSVELYDPETRRFVLASPMAAARTQHTASLLPSGDVLVAGGFERGALALASAELFEAATGSFRSLGSMSAARGGHTANVLGDGSVLLCGGFEGNDALASTERFDPASLGFDPGPDMPLPRGGHAAVRLATGDVLLAGGYVGAVQGQDVRYDATSETFRLVDGVGVNMTYPSAALLPTGEVLIAGGFAPASSVPTDATWLYRPGLDTLVSSDALKEQRGGHTLDLLPDGDVLSVGGIAQASLSSEILPLIPGDIESVAAMALPRADHTATLLYNGEVVIAGGTRGFSGLDVFTVERMAPGKGTSRWVAETPGPTWSHTATLLPDGKVLFAGGWRSNVTLASVFLYHPSSDLLQPLTNLLQARRYHTATLLKDGRVLLAGGFSGGFTNHAEVYDPKSGQSQAVGPMLHARGIHAATLLSDGRVLLTGGRGAGTFFAGAEVYDPDTATFEDVGPMVEPRVAHAATLLKDGRVLLTGGHDDKFAPRVTAEVFDPATEGFVAAPSMKDARCWHAAVALADGRVLVAGGDASADTDIDTREPIASTELYDPAVPGFAPGPDMARPRHKIAATRLPDGRVLLAGGEAALNSPLSVVEAFDPVGNRLDGIGPYREWCAIDVTVPLPEKRVLLIGARRMQGNCVPTAGAYDPTTLTTTWIELDHPRERASAALLHDGSVLVVGGEHEGVMVALAERFDPKTQAFESAPPLQRPRVGAKVVAFGSGAIVAGGHDADGPVDLVERWDAATSSFASLGSTPIHVQDAVRVGSGRVLLAGQREDGVASFLLYDVARAQLGEPSELPGVRSRAAVTRAPDGAGLVAADGELYRVEADGGFRLLAFPEILAPAGAVAVPANDALICDPTWCRWMDGATNVAVADAITRMTSGGGALTTSLSGTGDVLVFLSPDGDRPSGFHVRRHPSGARPPRITGAPRTLRPDGAAVTVTGTGFQHETAVGADAEVYADVLPLVVFVPADGGAAVPGRVASWSDTTLTWVPPRTAFHGSGWLHVIVKGVPSEGWFVTLAPAVQGAACATDGECETGACSDGICCDRSCLGSCETCDAAHQDGNGRTGVCGAVRAGTDPRDRCDEQPPDTCGWTGQCDGEGNCARHPDGTSCQEVGTCQAGVCVQQSGPVCDPETDEVVNGSVRTSCDPYRCRQGACLTRCASTSDCVAGTSCGSEETCETSAWPAAPQGCGACSASRRSPSTPWAVLAVIVFAWRRRRGEKVVRRDA